MYHALPYELTQAHIAGLHRQAEQDQVAYRARRTRRANNRYAATAHRSPGPATRARPADRPHPPVSQLNHNNEGGHHARGDEARYREAGQGHVRRPGSRPWR